MKKREDVLEELSALDPKVLYQTTNSDAFQLQYDFTEEELASINDLASQIDVLDFASLISYGADAQSQLSDFSRKKLSGYRTNSLSVAGEDLAALVTTLKTYDGTPEQKNPIVKFLKGKQRILEEARASYNTIAKNVSTLEKILKQEHLVALKDGVREFDEMYEINLEYYRILTLYIVAGKKKLEVLRTTELPKLLEKASKTGSAFDTQAASDLAEAMNSFEAKLSALQISRQLVIQQACQIRQLQKNYRVLAEEIVNILNNGIPAWEVQLRLALGVDEAKKSAAAVAAASEFTESLILKTATALAENTIETAKLANRPFVSLETVRKNNDIFIHSLEEVIKVNIEGMRTIRETEQICDEIEQKRNQALLDFSRSIQESAMANALGQDVYQPQTARRMTGRGQTTVALQDLEDENFGQPQHPSTGKTGRTPTLKL